MRSVDCREAKPSDIDEMARLRAAGGWTGGAAAERMARYLAGEHHPQHALAPRVIYVAEEGASMIGFIAGHLTRRFGCDGELQWIFVMPGHRGSGAAALLLHRLAAWFLGQGARRVCVDVDPENLPARRFYKRHGAQDLNPHWLVWPDIQAAFNRRSKEVL
jgi:GNAT superfamily N-acetyltransferase